MQSEGLAKKSAQSMHMDSNIQYSASQANPLFHWLRLLMHSIHYADMTATPHGQSTGATHAQALPPFVVLQPYFPI